MRATTSALRSFICNLFSNTTPSPAILILLAACKCGDQPPPPAEEPPKDYTEENSEESEEDDTAPPEDSGDEDGEGEEEEEITYFDPTYFALAVTDVGINDGLPTPVSYEGETLYTLFHVAFADENGRIKCTIEYESDAAEASMDLADTSAHFAFSVKADPDTYVDSSGRNCDDFDPDIWGDSPDQFMASIGLGTIVFGFGPTDDPAVSDLVADLAEKYGELDNSYMIGWVYLPDNEPFYLNYARVNEVIDGVVSVDENGDLITVDASTSSIEGPVDGLYEGDYYSGLRFR